MTMGNLFACEKIVAYVFVDLSGLANAYVICHLVSVSNCQAKKVQLSFVDHKKRPCRNVEFRHQDS
jgi:hypothetical protein